LPGTPTFGGVFFWKDIANEDGWRIQYNLVLDKTRVLRPIRLLDPKDYLWASTRSLEELKAELPQLIEQISKKDPLVTREAIGKTLNVLVMVGLTVLTKGKFKGKL